MVEVELERLKLLFNFSNSTPQSMRSPISPSFILSSTHRSFPDSVFYYIDASSLFTLRISFAKLAHTTQLSKPHDTRGVVSQISQWSHSWVLLIDGLEDPSLNLRDFLPSGSRGNIFITSRIPPGQFLQGIELTSTHLLDLSNEEALHLLLKWSKQPNEHEPAVKVVLKLGRIAMAIRQAGVYIGLTKGMDFPKYLALYGRTEDELLNAPDSKLRRMDSYTYPIVVATEILLRKLSDTNKDANELLRVFSYLHHEGLIADMLGQALSRSSASHAPKPPPPPGRLSKMFGKSKDQPPPPPFTVLGLTARKTAKKFLSHYFLYSGENIPKLQLWKFVDSVIYLKNTYSLIYRRCSHLQDLHQTQGMHTIVRDWIQSREQGVGAQAEGRAMACHLLDWSIPAKPEETKIEHRWTLLPHIRRCSEGAECPPAVAARFVSLYISCDFIEEARQLCVRVIDEIEEKKWEGVYGYEQLLDVAVDAANRTSVNGQYASAEAALSKSSAACERAFGPYNSRTLQHRSYLGQNYTRELHGTPEGDARWERPMNILKQVVDAARQHLAPGHRILALSLDHLANACWSSGDFSQGETLLKELIELRETHRPTEQASILTAKHQLAWNYTTKAKRYSDAEVLYPKIIEGRTRLLGSTHRDVGLAMSELGSTYYFMQRYQESENYMRRAVNIQQGSPGQTLKEKVLDLESKHILARSLHHLGRYNESEVLEREVLEKRRDLLGPSHSNTLLTMRTLSTTLVRLSRQQEAEELLEQIQTLEANNDT